MFILGSTSPLRPYLKPMSLCQINTSTATQAGCFIPEGSRLISPYDLTFNVCLMLKTLQVEHQYTSTCTTQQPWIHCFVNSFYLNLRRTRLWTWRERWNRGRGWRRLSGGYRHRGGRRRGEEWRRPGRRCDVVWRRWRRRGSGGWRGRNSW